MERGDFDKFTFDIISRIDGGIDVDDGGIGVYFFLSTGDTEWKE